MGWPAADAERIGGAGLLKKYMRKEEIVAAYNAATHHEKTRMTEAALRYILETTGRKVRRTNLYYYRGTVQAFSKDHDLFTAAYAAAIQQQNGTEQDN